MKYVSWVAGFAFVGFVTMLLGIATLAGVGGGSLQSSGCSSAPSADGEPQLIQFYLDAAAKYRLGANGYAYLGAINEVETQFGTDMNTSSAGAVGWMQFEPATFQKYAVSVSDPSAPADPDDPEDAIYTAAHMLAADGAPGDWSSAIYAYNHADWYVEEVEQIAETFIGVNGVKALANAIAGRWGGQQPTIPQLPSASADARFVDDQVPSATSTSSTATSTSTTSTSSSTTTTGTATTVTAASGSQCGGAGGTVDVTSVPGESAVIMPNGIARPPAQAPKAVAEIISAGDQLVAYPYCYGGGHDQIGVPNTGSGDGSVPCATQTVGYDCSGSTSAALYGARLVSTPLVSGDFRGWGQPGAGKWLTVYPDDGHVFYSIAGIAMDTVWFSTGLPKATKGNPEYSSSGIYETGPRWQPISIVGAQIAQDPALDDPRHWTGL